MMKSILKNFFKNPRHIEVQILAGKNRVVHLHERDCSVQRRHQKLIEETPSPVLNDEIRKDLFERTVKMVAKIGYMGACLLYTSPSPRDISGSRMPSSA